MKILLKNYNIKTPEELINACDGNEFLARILFNRGIVTYEKALEILDSSRYKPFDVLNFPRIDEVVDIREDIAYIDLPKLIHQTAPRTILYEIIKTYGFACKYNNSRI